MEAELTEGGGKREAILVAALQLFAEQGFHGATVPEIAKRAGIAAGTMYRYFPSKEALVNALYQHWKIASNAAVLADVEPEAPFREQFHALWRGLARFAVEQRTAFAFLELHHHAPYLDEESRRCEALSQELAGQFISSARRAQTIKDLPPMLVMAVVMGAFVGLVKASWAGLITLDEATLDTAEQCCWEAIRR